MSKQDVYTHPHSAATLLAVLKPCLPNALPLYRRLQAARKSEHAHVIATFAPAPPSSAERSLTEEHGGQNGLSARHEREPGTKNGDVEVEVPRCFAAAFVDRISRPGTEMYVFVSGEVDRRCGCAERLGVRAMGDITGTENAVAQDRYQGGSSIASGETNGSYSQTPQNGQNGHTDGVTTNGMDPSFLERRGQRTPCEEALQALLAHIATLPFPTHTPAQLLDIHRAANLLSPSSPSSTKFTPLKSHYPPHATFLTDIALSSVLKLGAAAALPVTILHRAGVLKHPPTRGTAHSVYTFRVPESVPRGRELGEGLRWGVPQEQDLDLVRVRTPIPRTHAGLRGMSGVAVFPEGKEEDVSPVAWAFVGYDGGLCSLHVEPEYRGRGIAKTLAARLFVEYPAEDGWALAFVGVGNRESEAVCAGIGGEVRSWCWWVRVDLDAVGRVVEETGSS